MLRCTPKLRIISPLPILAVALSGFLASARAADAPGNARDILAWQLALERNCFSPGVIDGRPGPKLTLATTEFQRSRGLSPTGKLDSATADALQVATQPSVTTYTIQDSDAKMVNAVPKGWVAKSKLRFLGYASLAEAIGERFHCSQGLLAQLNKGVNLQRLKVGQTLNVPAVQPGATPRIHHLEICLSQKAIRGRDSAGQVVALFHCSIAKDPGKRPSGEARIVSATPNPTYNFDPRMWPEVKNVRQKLLIPPGPRNPVGLCWIALSRRGYGIHGTPNPELIGKTGSHGCFRLTNWDALRLAKMVHSGMTVKFLQNPAPLAPGLASAAD